MQEHARESRSPGESGSRPLWLAFLASMLPGAGIVVLGFVLLWFTTRDAHRQVASDVGSAVETATLNIERLLDDLVAALRSRPPAATPSRAADGVEYWSAQRGDPGAPWLLNAGPPATVPLPETAEARSFEALVSTVELKEFREQDPLAAAREYRDWAMSSRNRPAQRARYLLAQGGALRRAGQLAEAVRVLTTLLGDVPSNASLDGLPLVYTLELQRVELLAADSAAVAPAMANDLAERLARHEIALPGGEVAAHLRDARSRLAPILGTPPDRGAFSTSALAALERAEERTARLPGLTAGTAHREFLGAGVLLAACSTDGLQVRAALVPLDLLRRSLPPETNGLSFTLTHEPGTPTPLSDSAPLRDLADLSIHGVGAQALVEQRVRPWRLAILAGVIMVIAMSFASAYLATRAVSRRLRLARLRSDLVASLSHELRTPLTAMMLNLEILQDDRADQNLRRENAERAGQSARRLQHLMDRVLTYSRSEHLDAAAEPEVLAPGDLLHAAHQEIRHRLQDRDLRIEVSEGLPTIHVDREDLVQVVVGLIDNALKYAGDGSAIVLRARQENEHHVNLEVEDHGPGVPSADREHLFEPFYRSPDRPRGRSGVGLGLAIARRVIEAHGGTIRAESVAPATEREGLRVVMQIPVARAPVTAGRR